jgi:type I restriction enzyme, S subunit
MPSKSQSSPARLSWPHRKLRTMTVKIGSGITPKGGRSTYVVNGIPFLRSQNIHPTGIETDGLAFITPAQHQIMASSTTKSGDVLLNITGASIGRCCVLPRDFPEANVSQHVCIIRTNGELDPHFLAAFLNSDFGQKLISVCQAGGNREGLNYEQIGGFSVPAPPLREQKRISVVSHTWNCAIEKLQALLIAKQKRFDGLRTRLLLRKSRFPQFQRTNWRRVQLSEVLKHVFRSVNWSPNDVYRLISIRRRCGGLFRREDLRGADYKTTDLHEIRTGDFLVSKRQVVHGAWGMVTKEFSGCHVSKEYSILVNKAPEVLHMPFFDWLCHEQRMWHLAFLASDGVHREKLIFDSRDFLRHYIELPPTIEEQEHIVQVLDACDREIRLLEAELEALKQQKRGLMQKLLTGEIRVKTPKS